MNKSIGKVLPVLFGFFVMGFCDVVGISTSNHQLLQMGKTIGNQI